MLDSNDRDRVDEAAEELGRMFQVLLEFTVLLLKLQIANVLSIYMHFSPLPASR